MLLSSKQLKNAFGRFALIGAVDGDSEELSLQKSLLVISVVPFILFTAGWAYLYFIFGEHVAACIPLAYSFFSLLSLIYFAYSRRFQFFRFSQLLLILVLPFVMAILLGGFVNGSSVILWALISPLGAMMFGSRTHAPLWLAGYILLVAVSSIASPWLRAHNNLNEWQITLFFAINIISVGGLVFMMVYYFAGRKTYFQQRSETLLLNILPKQVAEELKTAGRSTARYFKEVTVMFTDFKNFTSIAESLAPEELVNEIDSMFRQFDRIIRRHGIEKIKTIGDSYMCAAGLPEANSTHAEDTVAAALEIRDYINLVAAQHRQQGKPAFEIRIGINTGPVVAGVVGETKFAYDIWGDTVNLASRMESSCEPGKINISESTCRLVKNKFDCVYRGKVAAKNKGLIDMYFAEHLPA